MSASGSAFPKARRRRFANSSAWTNHHVQYLKWTGLMLQGNFGMAMEWERPVSDVIGDRLTLTMVISVAAIIFAWALACRSASFPRGLSLFIHGLRVHARRLHRARHSRVLLALIVMYGRVRLFRPRTSAAFLARLRRSPVEHGEGVGFDDKHLPIPAIVLGVAGTAQLIRIMAVPNLLDELRKPYVMTAAPAGFEYWVVMRYPGAGGLNPFVAHRLPSVHIDLGEASSCRVVLSLPTVGPLLLKALIATGHVPGANHRPVLGVLTVIGRHFGPAPDVDQLSGSRNTEARSRNRQVASSNPTPSPCSTGLRRSRARKGRRRFASK